MAGPRIELAVDHSAQQIDYTSTANTNYIGFASPGSLTSDARWSIRRVTLDSSGRPTQVQWANGNANYENSWDNRTALVYR